MLGFGLYQGFQIVHSEELSVTFCNVGQGDSIVIRTPLGSQFLIDGGPNESIHSCLLSHLPFWDRTLDVIFLTHPHLDHLAGLESVINRYIIKRFDTEKVTNQTDEFLSLMSSLSEQNIPINYLWKGDSYQTSDGVTLTVLGPSKDFLAETAPTGEINESEGFSNLVLLLEYQETSILFTGDSQVDGLKDALKGFKGDIDILHVPHHGSKSGLNQEVLDMINPEIAVFSVGKNKYGHPSKEMLSLLEKNNIKMYRTDRDGEVTIKAKQESLQVQVKMAN